MNKILYKFVRILVLRSFLPTNFYLLFLNVSEDALLLIFLKLNIMLDGYVFAFNQIETNII